MANRRMISKSISVSRKLARVSPLTALVFTWLIPHCDDGGNMAGDPETVKALVMPARPETVKDIEKALNEMIEIGLVDPYTINQDRFVHIVGWEDHQTLRMDRATWEYPAYPKGDIGNQSATSRQQSAAEGKVREGKVSKDNTYSVGFEIFWTAYPRKISKKKAYDSWKRIKPNDGLQKKIMESVKLQSVSDQWQKEDGRYIPHPTTWLNQERWNDELKIIRPKVGGGKFDNLPTTKA